MLVKALVKMAGINDVSEHIYSNELFIGILSVYHFIPSIQSGRVGRETTGKRSRSGPSGHLPETESPSHRVLRISQLDAFELDEALEQLVWSQFTRCFRHFKPGLLTRVEPEIKALLQLLVWRFTVYSSSATVGQMLLNLRYHNTLIAGQKYRSLNRKQKLWFALLTVGDKWLRERSHSLFLSYGAHPGFRRARQALAVISSVGKLASLLNFMLFLQSGRFPSLTERMLGLRPVFVSDQRAREIDFLYTNRELLWHGFAEFLIFLLPLIDVWKLKSRVSALFSVSDGPHQNPEPEGRSECGICAEWPIMPHSIGCSHVFCYYCVKSHTASDVFFTCPRCGAELVSVQPVDLQIEMATIQQT
ncbi:Peroxisome biogenesis factor 2 [Bagarius yarrelli]|uniref:Peroxisome biogenesis factor 2 n=1 Tax=Bagarius yarrelli TaxID=175774 RepID=A0A556TWR4_BAGYA|nr:Peroxisome biogenesis factor 2 [Bagarius yarrelli]